MPSYERESRSTPPQPEVAAGAPGWAIVALLSLVALMGVGAFALVLSGYTLI
jgi:hypothetical protein